MFKTILKTCKIKTFKFYKSIYSARSSNVDLYYTLTTKQCYFF